MPEDAMHQDAQRFPSELFTTIDHVGIAVPDLDEAVAFYEKTFGVHSVHEETNEEQGVREAMLAVGDGETRIQLLAPLSDDSKRGTAGSRVNFVHPKDAGGVLVELVQPATGH